MDIRQIQLTKISEKPLLSRLRRLNPDWIHIASSPSWMGHPEVIGEIRGYCPNAVLSGVSSNWQLCDLGVERDSFTLTAVKFEKTKIQSMLIEIYPKIPIELITDALAQGFVVAPKSALVILPSQKLNSEKLIMALRSFWPKTHFFGGVSGQVPPNWDSTVISDKGFSDEHLLIVGFTKELTITNLALDFEDLIYDRSKISLLSIEGSTLAEEGLDLVDPKSLLKEVRKNTGGHLIPMGFFTAGQVGAFHMSTLKNKGTAKTRGALTIIQEDDIL